VEAKTASGRCGSEEKRGSKVKVCHARKRGQPELHLGLSETKITNDLEGTDDLWRGGKENTRANREIDSHKKRR